MKIKPRYYQEDCFNYFFNFCANNHGKNPVLVLPTGSGKTICQAMIVEKILRWSETRILLLSHQKELLKQNATTLYNFLDGNIDIGVYSAGLKCRDYKNRVIVAGIQSVYTKGWSHLGFRDVVIVDECHLINSEDSGMYRKLLNDLKDINPKIIIAGMTATNFRSKSGVLTEGDDKIFDEVAYEVSIKELIDATDHRNRDKKQYLCNLISKNSINHADLSNVKIVAGDYAKNGMEKAYLKGDLVCRAIQEIKLCTPDRKKILIFCVGIKHAEEVTEKMNKIGLETRCIHSRKKNEENNKNIQDFKDGKFRFLCNMGILTTGFDEKAIDCIVLLRATKSPGLMIQMCGRGLRIHPDKKDCLILDMGENLKRFGPIDKIEIRKNVKTGKSEVSTCPMKECPNCGNLMFLTQMECIECGHIIEAKDKHDDKASDADVISVYKKPEKISVQNVRYARHSKVGKPDSLRVDYYYNDFQQYTTWVCIEHGGYARQMAEKWLRNVTDEEIYSVDEALELCHDFREPTSIIVDLNNKFPNITGYIFDEMPVIPDQPAPMDINFDDIPF